MHSSICIQHIWHTMYDRPNNVYSWTDRSQEVEELSTLEVLCFAAWSVADVQCTHLACNLQQNGQGYSLPKAVPKSKDNIQSHLTPTSLTTYPYKTLCCICVAFSTEHMQVAPCAAYKHMHAACEYCVQHMSTRVQHMNTCVQYVSTCEQYMSTSVQHVSTCAAYEQM